MTNTAPAAPLAEHAEHAEHAEVFIAERVAAFAARGDSPADARTLADEYDADGEPELASWYVEVARRLQAVLDDDALVDV